MHDSPPNRPVRPAASHAPALNWQFLQRTVRATFITAALVARSISVYVSIPVGARYLFFALWAVSFFSTTGLILKHLMIDRDRLRGGASVAAKFVLLIGIYALMWIWPIEGAQERAHMMAMVGGVTTPLIVLVLRALGWAMDQNKKQAQSNTNPQGSDSSDQPGQPPRAEFQMQS